MFNLLVTVFKKRRKEETGQLSLIGSGMHVIEIPFAPKYFHFDVKDDPADPNMSCNPTENDFVHVCVHKSHSRYFLKVKWNVLRVKNVNWFIRNY